MNARAHPRHIQIGRSLIIQFLVAVLLISSGAELSNARRFCILCGCAVAVLLWQLYRFRLDRNTVQSQSRAAGIREERERIARELHDTLIQSVHGLILTLQASTAGLPKTDRLRNEIDSALDRAGDLLDEARDRVSGLRVSTVPLDVARAISNSANMLSAAKPANFKLSVTGSPRPLEQKAAEHIHAITREAVANAFTHADAKTIEVEIGYQTKRVRVHVRDDGRGVGSVARIQSNASRHFGLQGMRERAEQIRGQLTIGSREGAGTEIALDVPATSAYLPSAPADRASPTFRAVVGVAHSIAGCLMSSRKNIAGVTQ
jgi:signal transduction histidine kinase